jgi:CheY-like chemotaxis protein
VAPLHLLLVDDDELTVLNTRRALRRELDVGKVTVAVDGRDAFDRLLGTTLAGDQPIVITDLDMPRMSGLDLIAAIRATRALRHLTVLVLTASADEADRRAAFALGAEGYFAKSSDHASFAALVACLRGHVTAGPGAARGH